MEKFLILVEGKADAPFIRDYLIFLNSNLTISLNNQKNKELSNDDLFIKIIVTGGKNISNAIKKKMQEHHDSNYKIIIIQDADNPQKDPISGGKELRLKYFEKIKNELKFDFKIFLFPNNENEGDLEKLLLKIINKNKFKKAFDCYKQYVDCSKEFCDIDCSELLEDKRLIFNYFRTYYGIERAKEEERSYKIVDWEFSNVYLSPLEVFLNSNISKKN